MRTVLLWLAALPLAAAPPGARVLLDAHNAYPYEGRWSGRLERALATGVPLAIEQDLYWFRDPASGRAWSVVAHGEPVTGGEPTLREHFFERVRPVVERALADNRREEWPLIVLNLDFKTNEPEHHAAVWDLLGEYEAWLTTAVRAAGRKPRPLEVKPLLVLTGADEGQARVFHDRLPPGARLRLFGAARVRPRSDWRTPPGRMVPAPADNYRRWWNNPWSAVEAGGPPEAGDWTDADRRRLEALVRHAHRLGYWIRFYTLNGYASEAGMKADGTGAGYNFGSLVAARTRWRACMDAGVDFIATDLYEDLAAELRARAAGEIPDGWRLERIVPLQGTLHHVQGIDVEDGVVWVSSVDAKARKGFLSRFEEASGRLLQQVEVQEGERIHPGGIALDGESVWIPVAEYDRDGPSSIQRRHKRTLALQSSFEVQDHIGCIAAGPGFLLGGNWDSRTLYRWTPAGALLDRRPNPGPAAYQDLKIVEGELLGSGLLARRRGVVEWLGLADYRLLRRVETGLTSRGVPFTNEGMAYRGGKLYLLPEDDPGRLFILAPR